MSVAHDTTVEVPGVARLRIQLPQEALGRVAEINTLRRRLTGALEDLGVGHVDEVDALADTTEQARSVLREANRDVQALLAPHGAELAAEAVRGVVPAQLQEQVAQARARVRAASERCTDGPDDGGHHDGSRAATGRPDVDPVDEQAARVMVAESTTALKTARVAQREAAQALAARRQEVTELTARLDRAEGRIAADTARLEHLDEQLAQARAEMEDQALADRRDACAARLAEATRGEQAAAQAVAEADVDGVRAALQSAHHRCRLADRAREDALAELHQLKGQVEMAVGEGRQELYQLAEADLEDAQRELRAVDRRARAARHLFAALHRHRDEAHRAYVRPYSQALEELGRRVYGPDFGVVVDEDLSLSARTLGGATVPFAELSGGAKEQLGILARLAVARLVDPTQGVPVVIDDALGYSDPDRLRRMGEVLGSTTDGQEDLQVILLTCTPDRYAAIPHVQTIRLSA